MIVTVKWIEDKYNKFNHLYFNDELPKIEFKISRSKHCWGYAGYIIKKKENTVTPEYISISNYYDSPEHVKECTLLHEMIHIKDYAQHPEHYWVGHRRNRYYDAHGTWFKNEAARFLQYGYDIAKNVTDQELEASEYSANTNRILERKKHNTRILAIFGTNHKVWFCKTSPENVDNLMKLVKKNEKWFNLHLSSIDEVIVYSTQSENYIERRSCYSKLSGWMLTSIRFAAESDNNDFKYVKTILY